MKSEDQLNPESKSFNEYDENPTRLQQAKIRHLVDENSQLKEAIEKLKLQVNQIDLYKTRCQNLKKQLQVCEGRQKFYDSENERRQSTIEEQMNLFVIKETQYLNEISKKNEIISNLEKKLDAETEKINEALYESENYHKENQSLNEEVEVLNNKINDLTKEIELKENNFNEERKTLEKSVIVL